MSFWYPGGPLDRGKMASAMKEGQQSESPCIGKEDLRQVQGHYTPWRGSCDLRNRKAQAAPGLVFLAPADSPRQGTGIRDQGSVDAPI